MEKSLLMKSWEKFQFLEKLKNKNSVYIIPTRMGFFYLAGLILQFAVTMSYQSPLGLASTFLFFSVFLLIAIFAHNNLAQVKLDSLHQSGDAWEGEIFKLNYRLTEERSHSDHKVSLTYISKDEKLRLRNLLDNEDEKKELLIKKLPLGVHQLEIFMLSSNFPYGLFRTWKYERRPTTVVVYPRPIDYLDSKINLGQQQGASEKKVNSREGGDEVTDLVKSTWNEAVLRRIDWKKTSRHGEPYLRDGEQSKYLCREIRFEEVPLKRDDQKARQITFWLIYKDKNENLALITDQGFIKDKGQILLELARRGQM